MVPARRFRIAEHPQRKAGIGGDILVAADQLCRVAQIVRQQKIERQMVRPVFCHSHSGASIACRRGGASGFLMSTYRPGSSPSTRCTNSADALRREPATHSTAACHGAPSGTQAWRKKRRRVMRVAPSKLHGAAALPRDPREKLRSRAGARATGVRSAVGGLCSGSGLVVTRESSRYPAIAHARRLNRLAVRATRRCRSRQHALEIGRVRDHRPTAGIRRLSFRRAEIFAAVESEQARRPPRPPPRPPVASASPARPRRSSPRRWHGRSRAGSSATPACRISTLRASEIELMPDQKAAKLENGWSIAIIHRGAVEHVIAAQVVIDTRRTRPGRRRHQIALGRMQIAARGLQRSAHAWAR